MNKETQLEAIKKACIAANLDKAGCPLEEQGNNCPTHQIRLADVLLAMQKQSINNCVGISYNGDFLDCDDDMNSVRDVGCRWNLLRDDLTQQSPETIAFLYELLKP